MPLYYDAISDTTTTTGTGTLTLAGVTAVSGTRTFTSTVPDGTICHYRVETSDKTAWEVGIGTFTSSGTTLSRTTILASSNSNNAVNFSSGTKNVYLVVSSRGFVGKRTIYIPATGMIARTTNGAAQGLTEMSTNKNMVATYDFDTSTVEYVQFPVWFPKSWDLGTVTFQVTWSHASTTTNFGVAWGLAGVAQSDDDTLDVAFGTEVVVTDTGGTTNDRYNTSESSAVTIAGTPAAGDVVLFQLSRVTGNAGDTMAIDARLHGIRLFYTTTTATDD